MKTIHNTCAFDLPPQWQDRTDIVLLSPGEGYRPSMLITHAPLDQEIDPLDYAAQQEPELRQAMGAEGFEILEREECEVAGLSALRLVYTCGNAQSRVRITQMQIYVIRGRTVHTITATDTAERFDETRAVFDQIVASLKFAD